MKGNTHPLRKKLQQLSSLVVVGVIIYVIENSSCLPINRQCPSSLIMGAMVKLKMIKSKGGEWN
jgi:hypothetical protein